MKESKRIHNQFNGNPIILKEHKIEVKWYTNPFLKQLFRFL
jgi:hypothetical protein